VCLGCVPGRGVYGWLTAEVVPLEHCSRERPQWHQRFCTRERRRVDLGHESLLEIVGDTLKSPARSDDDRIPHPDLLQRREQDGRVGAAVGTYNVRQVAGTGTSNLVDVTTGAESSGELEVQSNGTTIQLPEFLFTTVTTTVSVPDGGTVLLGGIKRLREGRNEYGVPILSKIPYINRLFKNVGLGRTTDSLMLMVTPRIIIQEEEEEKLLGTSRP
jgi:hypothetical protein